MHVQTQVLGDEIIVLGGRLVSNRSNIGQSNIKIVNNSNPNMLSIEFPSKGRSNPAFIEAEEVKLRERD
jgi:hypothetical protein